MSHKKKGSALSECGKCSCYTLVKDELKHRELCTGDGEDDEERCILIPQSLLRTTVQHVSDVSSDIPESAFGWIKANILLVSPLTLKTLEVAPRQPVVITTPSGEETTSLLWPSSQISPVRVWRRAGAREQRIDVRIVSDAEVVNHLQLRVKEEGTGNGGRTGDEPGLREFLQAYLRGSYLLANKPLSLPFCGRSFAVTPSSTLESTVQGLSLEEKNMVVVIAEHGRVLHVSSSCRVTLIHDEDRTMSKGLTFDAIPGLRELRKKLEQVVIRPIQRSESACSTIVYGVPGSGKSLVVEALARSIDGTSVTVATTVEQCVEVSPLLPPSCLFIADINELPLDKEHVVVRLLCDTVSRGVVVILVVRSVDDVPLSLRVRFPLEVEAAVPSDTEREEIIAYLLPKLRKEDRNDLARQTHAFTGSDLSAMVQVADCLRAEGMDTVAALQTARRRIRPTGLRQFALEVPTVCWSDIAGMKELKLEIEQAVMWPLSHRDEFTRFGVSPPSGILLYGPPGCSKTLIARALAHESRMNFISVKGPELFSKWVGDSEKAIRQLFARARQVAPTIVFFDEIDAVGTARGTNSSGGGVNERVLAQLLTELDGLEGNEGVLLLAATNRPDQLDSALLRPGRLDRALYVPLPTEETRLELLRLRAKKMPFDERIDMVDLVRKTEGYSGAELVAVCQTAALAAMRDPERTDKIGPSHFHYSLSAVRPRTNRTMLTVYEEFKRAANCD